MSKRETKKGIDAEESRRRRESTVLAVRKDKKEESLLKRRNISTTIDSSTDNSNISDSKFLSMSATESSSVGKEAENKKVFLVSDIPELLQLLQSSDRTDQFTGIRGFRKLLSVETKAPVQECINCGAIPHFVAYLQRHDYPDIQFEAAWALTNVASTERTSVVVECGSIPYLCQLLTVSSPEIREQAAWCLGNVAGDGTNFRDIILHHGALPAVVANIMNPQNLSLLRNCTWTLSNFCRGKPQPKLSSILPALPALQNLLISNVDQEAMIDASWALSYICDGDNDRIQVVVNLGIIHVLIAMLQSGKHNLIVPALRTLGNIASGDDSQTQAVVSGGVLPALVPLLTNVKKNIRKEALWMLSNIAAGSQQQLATLMNTSMLIPIILEQLGVDVDWDIRKEATWVICNVASSGVAGHIMTIVDHGAIRQLCSLLETVDVKMLMIVLEALEIILRVGQANDKGSTYISLIDEAEGIDKLEALQEHENEAIYKKAVHIIETFFGGEEDTESENVKPTISNTTYSFGLNVVTDGTMMTTGSTPSKPAFNFTQGNVPQQPMFTFAFPPA